MTDTLSRLPDVHRERVPLAGRLERVAVLDFETTGLSPAQGDRPTEVAIAVVEDGRIVDRYQSLMNPGRPIPGDIVRLTGITNAMVECAPGVAQVMREAAAFVGRLPLVAHNAAFDRRFWLAELQRQGLDANAPFACTLLLARRVYPEHDSHKLGALARALDLPATGRAHRALADAEMAAHLWCRLQQDLAARHGVARADHVFLCRLQATPKAQLQRLLAAA